MIAGLQGSPLVGIAGIDVAVPANLSSRRQFVDLGQGVGKVPVQGSALRALEKQLPSEAAAAPGHGRADRAEGALRFHPWGCEQGGLGLGKETCYWGPLGGFSPKQCQGTEGGQAEQGALFQGGLGEGFVALGDHRLQEGMLRVMGLDQDRPGRLLPPRSPRHLYQKLGKPLRGAKVSAKEAAIAVDDHHQLYVREVMAFGEHLRS